MPVFITFGYPSVISVFFFFFSSSSSGFSITSFCSFPQITYEVDLLAAFLNAVPG
jgi:hypothetical protein